MNRRSLLNDFILCLLTICLCSVSSLKMLSTKKYETISREILERHNIYRQCHDAPPLELDQKLNRQAQKLANNLAKRRNNTPTNDGNVFVLESNHTLDDITSNNEFQPWYYRPVDSWYREKTFHSENSLYTDHFTQLVWKGSKKLGVGVAQNDDGIIFVVCQYDPSGNVESTFQDNVSLDVSSAHASDICILSEVSTRSTSIRSSDSVTPTILTKLTSTTTAESATDSSTPQSTTWTRTSTESSDLTSTFGLSTPPSTILTKLSTKTSDPTSTFSSSIPASVKTSLWTETSDLTSTTGSTQPSSMPTKLSTDSFVLTSILGTSTWQSTSVTSLQSTESPETSSIQPTNWTKTTTWNDTSCVGRDCLTSTSTTATSTSDEVDPIISMKTNQTEDISKEMPEKQEFMTLTLVLMSLLVVSLSIVVMVLTVFILLKLFICCARKRCALRREKRQATDASAQQPTSTLCVVSTSQRPGSPLPSRPDSPPFQATSLTRLY